MKVSFVARKYDQDGGGSNKSLRLIIEQLQENGYDVSLLTTNSELNSFKDFPVEVHEYNAPNSKVNEIRYVSDVLQNHSSTDLFHIFNPGLIPSGGLFRTNNKTPVVGRLNTYTLICTNMQMMDAECYNNCGTIKKAQHDASNWANKMRSFPEYLGRTHVGPWLANKVDRLIAISPTVKEVYEANGYNNIDVVPNFFDPDFSTRQSNQQFNENKILYVGRLEAQKGVDILIESVGELDKRVSLDIIGDGSQRRSLEKQATTQGIANRAKFHGWVSYKELPRHYASAEIFVHPGRWPEPFGRTVLEALQQKTTCIVSDIGGPPWIVGDEELIFEPGNAGDLAECINKQLDKRKNRVEKKDNLNRFKPERVVRKLQDTYDSLQP